MARIWAIENGPFPLGLGPGNLLMEQVAVRSGSVLYVRGWRTGYTDTAVLYTRRVSDVKPLIPL